MLWDEIFKFYVMYIFGGRIGNDQYSALLGRVYYNGSYVSGFTTDFDAFKYSYLGDDVYMSLGNYLSFIATIITMVAILLFCVFIIKKIIGIMFRLATGSSAF